jgi:anti-sigma factor RsiW
MNEEQQIKLQAFLDGELPEAETRDVANWLARDPAAAALLGELKNTRAALAHFERPIQLPESREFFWSKIERQIQSEQPEPEAVPQRHTLFSFWRRAIPVLGGFAALIIALLVMTMPGQKPAADMEVAMADSDAFTYRNYESGTTLVWLSYPAENDVATGQPTTTIQ